MSFLPPENTMSDEELQCIICYNDYTRNFRIPRQLHCNHTFCGPCLQRIAKLEGSIYLVRCPVCRWISCIQAYLTVSGGLWVDIEIWDKLKPYKIEDKCDDDLETQKPKVSKPSLSALKQLFRRRPLHRQSHGTAAKEKRTRKR
ncbi:RING finger protein 224-like [Poeciliopsis prolifica]|uniref:RING finger protein 224-like n=1 Tax=Poeciliopsis prolifica TaxID=188132 RepID=UPI00072D7B25|nr:RING finger protein 224-like [Poeciliopsis prolifica]XP_054882068.1 RING finger protein 224-like [Poeciliopsis prolifica]XP_054882072.1 RING finger protein 224-like [Poeciliopsis prolifica]